MGMGMSVKENQLNALIKQWEKDPIWDLEDTEGFEEHRERLLAHRVRMELIWEEEHQRQEAEYKVRAEKMTKAELLRYCESLERRIEKLECMFEICD
jgi:hypothetical protein